MALDQAEDLLDRDILAVDLRNHRPTRAAPDPRCPCANCAARKGLDDRGERPMTDLYQSQRAMRNMRRAAMQRGVIAILDVGTSKIACLILRFDGSEPAARGRWRRADGRAIVSSG